MSKLRIAICSEFSALSSGFATISYELLRRLQPLGKYKLYEFATYGDCRDPRIADMPWGVYGHNPITEEEAKLYKDNPNLQFGRLAFEHMLVDLKPHLCLSFADPWMFDYTLDSPLRQYTSLAWMPTIDSAPQQDDWIAKFLEFDHMFAYTDYGKKVLEKQSGGKIHVEDVCGCGFNPDTYMPIPNKTELRKMFGLPEDAFIIGSIMRNQKRKLFPDIIKAFEIFISKASKELAKKSFLYFHTGHPDVGYDFAKLIKWSPVGHKVMFTYRCKACANLFPALFQDARSFCPRCKQSAVATPNTGDGISSTDLCKIYNVFDAYVQMAIASGIEIPAIEAAACGVPVFCLDYAGMEDHKEKLKATPISVDRFFLESETHAYRAFSNNQELAEKLLKFSQLPKSMRDTKGFQSKLAADKHYSYDVVAKKWEKFFDKLNVDELEKKWASPPQIRQPAQNCPQGLNNEDFVAWCILHVLGEPAKLNTYWAAKLVKNLNYGAEILGHGGMELNNLSSLSFGAHWVPCSQESVFKQMVDKRNHANYWEAVRCKMTPYEAPDFVKMHKEPNDA